MDEEWGTFLEQPIGVAPAGPGGAAGMVPAPMSAPMAAPDAWSEFAQPGQSPAQQAPGLPSAQPPGQPPAPTDAEPFNKDAFNSKFTGPLADKADVIQQKAQQYGVPPSLASAIIAQETGWGKFVKGNNVAGMMDGSKKMQFGSIDEGIDRAVSNIAKQYENGGKTVEGLQKIYAPIGAKNDPNNLNSDWLPGVKKIMGMLQ